MNGNKHARALGADQADNERPYMSGGRHMTDQQPPSNDDDPTTNPTETGQGAGAAAERMLAQLQSMIDSIATQATPVVKQVGAKAAELAAAAADRAGPIAHKAADATAGASVKIASRSREFAADLRRDSNGHGGTATAEKTDIAGELRDETASSQGDASGAVNTVLDDATDRGDTA
jgi:hypothetical protein